MAFTIQTNNKQEVISALNRQALNALEICGGKAETYAKRDCPVDMGILRNSIAHLVDGAELKMYVGTDTHYAPYVEFGTGIYYVGGRRTSWVYQDARGDWHRTTGQKPQPFIKPSIAKHEEEYRQIIKNELQGK